MSVQKRYDTPSHAAIVNAQYQDLFISDLVHFLDGDEFQERFQAFFLKYCMEFDNEEEQKLKFYDYFLEYQRMFEEQLDGFCRDHNVSPADFVTRCQQASTHDIKSKLYMDILLANVEYDTFLCIMKTRKRDVQLEDYFDKANALFDEWEADIKARDDKKEAAAEDAKAGATGDINEVKKNVVFQFLESAYKTIAQKKTLGDSKGSSEHRK